MPDVPPTSGDGATASPPRAGAKPVRREALIVLGLGVALTLAFSAFGETIAGLLALQPWNKAAPAKCVEDLTRALATGDVAGLESASPGARALTEGGAITHIKMRGSAPMSPYQGAAACRARLPLQGATYDYRYDLRRLRITAVGESGATVIYELDRSTGGWGIRAIF